MEIIKLIIEDLLIGFLIAVAVGVCVVFAAFHGLKWIVRQITIIYRKKHDSQNTEDS